MLTTGVPRHAACSLWNKIAAYQAVGEGMITPLTPDETHIIIDTGASISITNEKEDFI